MLSYCLKCGEKKQESCKVKKMLCDICVVCDSKKLRFIKQQETERFLCMIGNIPLIGPLLI